MISYMQMEEIEDRARDVLEAVGFDGIPPVDPVVVAQQHSLDVRSAFVTDNTAGMLS